MSPDELRKWRLSLPTNGNAAVTPAEAARRLNNTPDSTYRDWEAGRKRPPRMLPLACFAVSKGWVPPNKWTEE